MGENKISSLQNTKVKQLVALQQKSSERRKQGVFVVEGIRELQHCLNAGYTINSIFFCPELTDTGALSSLLSESIASYYEVSPEVYEKIAYRGSTEGVIATVQSKQLALKDLHLSKQPLLIVLESVEKPGNLGAILRSADAAGADAVIICDPLTDLYNPNLIRSSIGAIFSVTCIACSSDDCINFLKQNNINILTAQLQDSKLYYDTDMTCGTAIIMGTESTGLTDVWRKAADAHIRIPMLGQLDSLNVSVSAAILLFEAVRQRKIETSQSSKS
ncbi:MAG: RNA methyltransferase [Bacteroidaceae bacterium]|nr:RNA methyltransferase [Bacteroidaceae bacterium]